MQDNIWASKQLCDAKIYMYIFFFQISLGKQKKSSHYKSWPDTLRVAVWSLPAPPFPCLACKRNILAITSTLSLRSFTWGWYTFISCLSSTYRWNIIQMQLIKHQKKHRQRHNGPKAFSTLTHWKPLVQSRKFNKSWSNSSLESI